MNLKAFVFSLLMPAYAAAQQPLYTVPGEDKIVALKEGDKAPFEGQLFSPDTALRWASWLEQYKVRLEIEKERAEDLCTVDLDYRDQLLLAEKARYEASRKDLLERLARSEKARIEAEEALRNPSWTSSREFGLVLGVMSSAAAAGIGLLVVSVAK